MREALPPYSDHLSDLSRQLGERGGQGLVLLELAALEPIEDEYGSEAYEEVRERLFGVLSEQRGKDYRTDDIVALDQVRGRRLLVFLERKRRRDGFATLADVKQVAARIAKSLGPKLARAAIPYMKSAPRLNVGHGVAIHNPLLHPERSIRRAIEDAAEAAAHRRLGERLAVREKLLDLLLRGRVVTAYQPIVSLADRSVLAFEALSRGPKGSGLEAADALFGAATDEGLLVELDRLCRARALLCSGRIPSNSRLFVNTLPATIRDPQFRGKALIDFLEQAQVAPSRIVIEITEKLVIENYSLFRESMAYFTDLGMAFAVDDVGAGYSGLESIARLKPAYLKIDTALVRDLHISLVNREMVKAIVGLGQGVGATVIAEGLQTEDELRAVADVGVGYGQGFILGRPVSGPDPGA